MVTTQTAPPKASADDFLQRFREIVSDPLNVLIERHPRAGHVEDGMVVLHNGLRVPVAGYFGGFSDILVINRGVHEPLEEFVFQQLLRRLPNAPLSLELGAYWSHYSMWLKQKRPAARVFMVEPQRPYLDEGKRNFDRNGMTGEFIEAFVAPGQFEVDKFMEDHALARLDVLHTDIDLHELAMIEGAQQSLASHRVDYLLVSTHSQPLHAQVMERLRRKDYRIEVQSDFDHETTAFDGFVFASSPRVPRLFRHFRPLGRGAIATANPTRLLKASNQAQRSTRRSWLA